MDLIKKLFGSRRSYKRPSNNTTASRTYRDYGQEALADPENSDIVKGVELLCALDEQTCLTCLELEGARNPPELPIHEGCRCITLPVTKTFKELCIDIPEFPQGTRASAIGPVAEDGGLYKQYLIQRARLTAKNRPNAEIAADLAAWLASASKGSDDDVVASIQLAIFAISKPKSFDEVRLILGKVRWNAAGEHAYLFTACAEAGEYGALTEFLRRMANNVPAGPYSGRHRGMLYRSAAKAVKPFSLSSAIELLIRAVTHDPLNVAVLVQLASLQRSAGKSDQARCTIEKALGVNPTHKGALRELERLSRKGGAG